MPTNKIDLNSPLARSLRKMAEDMGLSPYYIGQDDGWGPGLRERFVKELEQIANRMAKHEDRRICDLEPDARIIASGARYGCLPRAVARRMLDRLLERLDSVKEEIEGLEAEREERALRDSPGAILHPGVEVREVTHEELMEQHRNPPNVPAIIRTVQRSAMLTVKTQDGPHRAWVEPDGTLMIGERVPAEGEGDASPEPEKPPSSVTMPGRPLRRIDG